jgi:sec-independent protein translocase protein TatB
MFPEVGATELIVIAAIALIVVGPKDLPILMRKVGQFLARMRSMAMEFRASFDEMARQSELDELRREVEAMRAAAHAPYEAASQAMGLPDINAEMHKAFSGEPATPSETPAAAEAAAEAAPKPKRVRKPRKPKTAEDETAAPEAQP